MASFIHRVQKKTNLAPTCRYKVLRPAQCPTAIQALCRHRSAAFEEMASNGLWQRRYAHLGFRFADLGNPCRFAAAHAFVLRRLEEPRVELHLVKGFCALVARHARISKYIVRCI